MIKIKEINAHNYNTPCTLRDRGTKIGLADQNWVNTIFSEGQKSFLKNSNAVFRRHPKNYSVIEIFVDEQSIDSKQITMLHLLF